MQMQKLLVKDTKVKGRAAGKGSDLNKRLRIDCLEESGTKAAKCARLAAYMLKNKILLDQA